MTRKPKPAAPGQAADIESMIRVDHAGEYGAVRIYQGQLAVLKRRKGAEHSVETITHNQNCRKPADGVEEAAESRLVYAGDVRRPEIRYA